MSIPETKIEVTYRALLAIVIFVVIALPVICVLWTWEKIVWVWHVYKTMCEKIVERIA
jgi:hypothetical protein